MQADSMALGESLLVGHKTPVLTESQLGLRTVSTSVQMYDDL